MNNLYKFSWRNGDLYYGEYTIFWIKDKNGKDYYIKIRRQYKVPLAHMIILENAIFLKDLKTKNKINYIETFGFGYNEKNGFNKEDLKEIFLNFIEKMKNKEIFFEENEISSAIEWIDKVLFCEIGEKDKFHGNKIFSKK